MSSTHLWIVTHNMEMEAFSMETVLVFLFYESAMDGNVSGNELMNPSIDTIYDTPFPWKFSFNKLRVFVSSTLLPSQPEPIVSKSYEICMLYVLPVVRI